MDVVVFRYHGRFAHFLRAETTVNAMTYPVPPRTVIFGLIGAVLGLPKDCAQEELTSARIAVAGKIPSTFWHKTNMRKNLPAPLAFQVKKNEKGTSKDEKNTRIPQEFLWKPSFRVFVSLPDRFHHEFANRVEERRWHFSPCMGLSELLANLEWEQNLTATQLGSEVQYVNSVVPLDRCKLDSQTAYSSSLALHKVRMPRDVTRDRVFTHANYVLERDGQPIPVESDQAWQVGDEKVIFL
ncbi:MAG: type I-B CRISPR-associated protein Cas5 [Planctomycetales bacterium]|nr:type I-B CRISPR-associated protein Cas5 [Planctomycetales bacterium]